MQPDRSSNQTLLALREEHVPRGIVTSHPIFIERAAGARLWDVDGKEYIDFAGGIGVLNVGHNHPRVIQAVQAQLERFTHVAFYVAGYEPYIRLAERLNALAPGAERKKTVFFTTGAEANENAIKLARLYTRRPAIVAFTHSFHGRTLLNLTLTGKVQPYKQGLGPFAPEVYHTPFPYAYRGWSSERALEALAALFETQVSPDTVAAIIIEPVLGEGGFVPAPPEFLVELRRITEAHGILLIADEVQSGFGRTGKLFGIEHSGIEPDLITVAKSMAGGLPLSGVIGRAEVMDAAPPGSMGGTYGGNPLACAAGLAVLDIFQEEGLLDQGQQLGQRLMAQFHAWQARFPQIGDVRGLGAMVAMEFVRDPATQEPAPEIVDHIVAAAREKGLLLLKAGMYGNVLRVLTPLMIEDALLDQALDILGGLMESMLEPHHHLALMEGP